MTRPAAPSAAALARLDSDRWAALLPHVRAVLRSFDGEELDADLRALRDAPTSRLAVGAGQQRLRDVLAAGGPVWDRLAAQVAGLDPVPPSLAWLVERPADGSGGEVPEDRTSGSAPAPAPDDAAGGGSAGRDRARLRDIRDQRDRWRRRAEGAEARAGRLERELVELHRSAALLDEELAAARVELADAATDRQRAVERERRRREAELDRLRSEVAGLRRAEEDRRLAERRRIEVREQAERDAVRAAEQARRDEEERRSTKIVPGRPTQLPRGVAQETTEAAKLLLHRGRLVLIDGYNVTLQHRKHLDLETQRSWLAQLAGALASQRGVRPVVIFDGDRQAGGAMVKAPRGVEVRFSSGGTADDEIVLAVEGTDEPVVVVTDDRELRARVRLGGADLIGTRSFLGAVP